MNAAPQPVAEVTESEFHTFDGLRLYYQSWRRPDVEAKRVVVMVHGFADHSSRYGWLVQDLAAHGAVVYGYDQRGNGNSDGKRGHIMDFSELVRDLGQFYELALSKEPGLERVLYSHSTGGITALAYALEHPDRIDRMILSAPALILAVDAPAWKTTVGKLMAGIAPKVTMNAGFDPAHVSRDEAVVARNKQDPLVTQAITTRFYREVYLKAGPEMLRRIEELRVPFIYLHGSEDKLISPAVAEEFRRRATPPHQVNVYEGSRHETHNDLDREKVLADIERWLESSPV